MDTQLCATTFPPFFTATSYLSKGLLSSIELCRISLISGTFSEKNREIRHFFLKCRISRLLYNSTNRQIRHILLVPCDVEFDDINCTRSALFDVSFQGCVCDIGSTVSDVDSVRHSPTCTEKVEAEDRK